MRVKNGPRAPKHAPLDSPTPPVPAFDLSTEAMRMMTSIRRAFSRWPAQHRGHIVRILADLAQEDHRSW